MDNSTIILIYNVSIWKWMNLSSLYTPLNDDNLGEVVKNCYIIIDNGYIMDIKDYHSNELDRILSLNDYDVIINGHSQLLLPGLIDSHIHINLLGESQYYVDLSDCYSIDMMNKKISMHNNNFPHLSWIIGINWDQEKLQLFPNRYDLDQTNIDKPIFLWRACWHIGVANSIGLEMIGLLIYDSAKHSYYATNKECPEGGMIEYDHITKLPTGILKERAVELVNTALQQVANSSEGKSQKLRFIQEGMKRCVNSGLTSVQTNDESSFQTYLYLQEHDLLPLRIFLTPIQDEIYRSIDSNGILNIKPIRPLALTNSNQYLPQSIPTSNSILTSKLQYNAMDSISRLIMERVKIFSDGSLGAQTAALRIMNNNSNNNSNNNNDKNVDNKVVNSIEGMKGILINTKDELVRKMFDTYLAGYRLEIHAIGDAAAEHVLACLDRSEEQINEYYNRNLDKHNIVNNNNNLVKLDNNIANHDLNNIHHHRPILTHCQVLGADIIKHMNRKGVVANIQPSFVPTDMNDNDIDMQWIRSRVSEQQLQYSYVWKTLLTQSMIVNNNTTSTTTTANTATTTSNYNNNTATTTSNYNNNTATTASSYNNTTTAASNYNTTTATNNTPTIPTTTTATKVSNPQSLYVAGGSDAPIETPNPFTGIYDAIYRTNKHKLHRMNKSTIDINDEEVFLPHECLSFSQALWIYTIGGAIASDCEHILGQINKRYVGDLVLVNPEIITNTELLYNYQPDLVFVGGKIEFMNKNSLSEVTYNKTPSLLQYNNNSINNNSDNNLLKEIDLSDSIYIPGKGGKPIISINASIETPMSQYYCTFTSASKNMFQCACILRGKHCMKPY